MAEGGQRVAGIYSEIEYRFDRQSIKNLRNFKKDLREVKHSLDTIQRKAKGVRGFGIGGKGQAQQAQKTAQAAKRNAQSEQSSTKSAMKRVQQYKQQNQLYKRAVKHKERIKKAEKKTAEIAERNRKQELATQAKIKAQKEKINRLARGADGQGNARNIQRVQQAQERLNRAYRNGSISASQYSTQSARVTRMMRRQAATARRTSMSMQQLQSSLAGATGAYSAFAGVASMQRIGGQFEDAGVMMETALKDQAGPAMEFLIGQSRRLGIGAVESAKGFARYSLAAKRLGFTFEDTKEQFLGVAEAATVFGLTQEQITGTIRAMEQMASKGQIMAEELKLQLGDRMPAVMGVAAKSMNMTTQEFLKAMEQGQITAEKFLPVFTKALRAEAQPGIAKALQTTNVAMKKMIQNGKLLVRALFNAGLGDLFTEIFNMLSDIFRIMEPILAAFVAFGTTIIRSVIFPIRLAIALVADLVGLIDYAMGGSLTKAMTVLGKIAGFVATIFGGLVKTIRPIFNAFSWMFSKVGQFMPSMRAGNAAMQASGKADEIIGGVKRVGQQVKTGSRKALERADESAFVKGGGIGQGGVDAYRARDDVQRTYIEFTGEAKESLRENRNEGSRRSMKSNTRG